MNKLLSMQALMLGLTVSSFTQEERRYEPRPDTSNIGGGYAHNGMYSQPKKLRKGAGQKKLTRAQRRKGQR